jgi:hypothetical protein
MDSMNGAVVSPGYFGYEVVRVRILTATATKFEYGSGRLPGIGDPVMNGHE